MNENNKHSHSHSNSSTIERLRIARVEVKGQAYIHLAHYLRVLLAKNMTLSKLALVTGSTSGVGLGIAKVCL